MKHVIIALTLVVVTFIAASTTSAGSITTPGGLNPGDQFRIVFITDSTITATDPNLSTYDNLVTTEANGTTYNGNVIAWHAIVSNVSAKAIDHIGENVAQNIPVYLVDGTIIANSDNASGLWSGAILNPINEDLSGVVMAILHHVWTGTSTDGTTNRFESMGDTRVIYGRSDLTSGGWVEAPVELNTFNLNLYGISDVLTVTPATSNVPEPSTAMLAGLGGLVAWAYSVKDKRN